MIQRGMKFISKFVTWPAAAAAFRASALDHELWNDAVKRQPVVKILFLFFLAALVRKFLRAFGKPDEIRDRFRGFFFQQPHNNVALRRFKNSVHSSRSAHAFSL